MPCRVALVSALSLAVARAGAAVADPGAVCGDEDEASLMQMRGSHKPGTEVSEQKSSPRTSDECKTKEHYCRATCDALDETVDQQRDLTAKCFEACMEKGGFLRSKCVMNEYCHHKVCDDDDDVRNVAKKVSKDSAEGMCRTKDHYCTAFCHKYGGVWDDCHERCSDKFPALKTVWDEYCTHDVCPCTPKPPHAKKTALLIVDVQNCFLDKDTSSPLNGGPGSLPVTDSHKIIPKLNQIRNEKDCLFDLVVRTRDFHPANHISFASTHGLAPFSHLTPKGGLPIMCLKPSSDSAEAACCPKQHIFPDKVDCDKELCPEAPWTWATNNPSFVENNVACTQCKDKPGSCFETKQEMWTDHCLQTGDSTFPASLVQKPDDIISKKGDSVNVDAYSAFYDNSKHYKTSLDETLHVHNVDELYVAGIATDVCVDCTVCDALSDLTWPYSIKVIGDASAGLSKESHEAALAEMAKKGAEIVSVDDVLAMSCPARAK